MRAVVCVPWRGGDPTREDAWERVRGNGFPYPYYTGDSDPTKPFNRAAARNAAVRVAPDADVYVFNDADHALSHGRVQQAVEMAAEFGFAVHPYSQVVVQDLLTGNQWPTKWDRSYTSGNIVVSGPLLRAVGGWDERFESWGHEDIAFAKLLVWLTGPLVYLPGPALAFNHFRGAAEVEGAVPAPALMERYNALRTLRSAYDMAQEVKAYRGL